MIPAIRRETHAHDTAPNMATAATTRVAVGAILLASAVLRFWRLGANSVWLDEAYSVFVAKQNLLAIPGILSANDTHPPLHYVLLHFWMALFGTSEIAIRSLSVLAGLAAIGLTFLLARRLAGTRVAVLAAALMGLSPFQIMASRDARMYPFLALFAAAASYALWLALEDGQRKHWAAYALCLVLAFYTHHFAALVALTHGVYVLAVHRGRVFRTWLLWMALVGLAYAPLLPYSVPQFINQANWPHFRPPISITALTDTLGMFSFGGGLFGMGTYFRRGTLPLEYRVAILLPFALLVLGGMAALPGWRRRLYIVGYWLMPVAVAALISLRWNIFYERYFSFVLPPFAILLAAGILHVADRMPGAQKPVAVAGLLVLLASFQLPSLAAFYRERPAYNWRAAAQYVTRRAGTNDFILYVPGFARIPFEYYYQGRQARMSLNPKEVLAESRQVAFQTIVDPAQMAGLARTHPRMWIVATIPIGYEARQRLGALLAPYFKEIEGRDFGAVFTFLWESRVYPGADARR